MKVSYDALAGTVIIGLTVAAGIWFAQDPECQSWPLTCLGTGTKERDRAMSRAVVNAITWSADGHRLLARFGCENEAEPRLVLLNAAQSGTRFEFDPAGDVLSSVAQPPDVNRILVATWQGRLWWLNDENLEVATPSVAFPFRDQFTATAVAPGGGLIAAATTAGRIWLFDLISRRHWNWEGPERSTMRNLRFSRDGKQLLAAQNNGRIILWDVATRVILREFAGHGEPAPAVEFLGDGQRIISGGMDDTIRLWDTETGRELWRGEFGMNGVQAVAVSADVRMAAWGGFSRKVVVWDVDLHRKKYEIAFPATCVYSLQFSPDGRTLAAAGRDEWIHLYDTQTGVETGRLEVVGPERL